MKLFPEKTKAVLEYLQAHNGEDMTAKTVAEAIGSTSRSVSGVVTSLTKRGYAYREGDEKFIRLTVNGVNVDPDGEKKEPDTDFSVSE